jgi:hypothetical protein
MYLAEMNGRNISSAEIYTKGRGEVLLSTSGSGDVDMKVSHILRAIFKSQITV